MIALDPHVRGLYVDWEHKARAVVEHLRLVAGRHPGDPLLASLLGDLAINSPEFAELWAGHNVWSCDVAEHELRYPLVGRLSVTQQALRPVDIADQSLVVLTCEEGSASAAALTLLSQAIAPAVGATTRTRPARSPEEARSR